MLEAVILDVDGTLIDSVDFHAEAWRLAFAARGREIPFAEIRSQIGKGGDQLMPVFLSKEEIDRFGEALQKERSDIFKREFLSRVKPFPRVRDLLLRVRADGRKIALASSAKEDELKQYEEIAGIEDLIDVATSSDDADRSKPYPDIFNAALKKLGNLDPNRAIAIGDTPYDAEAARKAGIRTIGVLSGGFPEELLRAAGCIAIYRDPADLVDRYDSSALAERS